MNKSQMHAWAVDRALQALSIKGESTDPHRVLDAAKKFVEFTGDNEFRAWAIDRSIQTLRANDAAANVEDVIEVADDYAAFVDVTEELTGDEESETA